MKFKKLLLFAFSLETIIYYHKKVIIKVLKSNYIKKKLVCLAVGPVLGKTLKVIRGVLLNNRKVLQVPDPRTKYFEGLFSSFKTPTRTLIYTNDLQIN